MDLINDPNKENDPEYGFVDCKIGGFGASFMIDSGAGINTVSEQCWSEIKRCMEKEHLKITVMGTQRGVKIYAFAATKPLEIVETFKAEIYARKANKPTVSAEFFVVKGGRRSLLGRKTARDMGVLRMGAEVLNMETQTQHQTFPTAPIKPVSFIIDSSVRPSRQYHIRIPDAFVDQAEARLMKMWKDGIIEKVEGSPEWLSTLNVVMKGPNDFRLTLNMKRANQAIRRPYYPIPTLERIRAKTAGAKVFSKLDLSQAFYHLPLDERSRNMTCFMTSFGIFRYTRLLFGANSAPEIFQRFMEDVLKGIEGVTCFIDDMLLFAKDVEQLREITAKVKDALEKFNLTLNDDKCEYEKAEIKFLGHTFNKDGININEEKTKAIKAFRRPNSVSETKSFLGLANFVSSFIPNYAELTETLRRGLRERRTFTWTAEMDGAFEILKAAIINCTTTLGSFKEKDETHLYTDASGSSVGAVLTQIRPSGLKNIVAFASRLLTDAERRYDQTSREALAMIWAVEHFQSYLIGREFRLVSDSSGAIGMMTKSESAKSKRVMHRAEGWRYRMEMFSASFWHVKGKLNIADCATRLVKMARNQEGQEVAKCSNRCEIATLEINTALEDRIFESHTLTIEEVATETGKDEVMHRVKAAMDTGVWAKDLTRYEAVKQELVWVNGILMRMEKIVIPRTIRAKALAIAHKGHPGMNRMKRLLRERVWWPRLDKEVEAHVKACDACFHITPEHNVVPMKRSSMPKKPQDKMGVDHFGPMAQWGNKHVLAMIDYHSRYLKVKIVKSTSFEATWEVLEEWFDVDGNPITIRCDNGPAFRSEFEQACNNRGIIVEHSIPYNPMQNGMVEASMKTVGKAMRVAHQTEKDYAIQLKWAVIAHNSTPHSVTGMVPEEAMFGRRVRRGLPSLRDPDTLMGVEEAMEEDAASKLVAQHRENAKRRTKESEMMVGDQVVVKLRNKNKLDATYGTEKFTISGINNGDVHMTGEDGRIVSKPIRDLKRITANEENANEAEERLAVDRMPYEAEQPSDREEDLVTSGDQEVTEQEPERRRSARVKKAPAALDNYVREIVVRLMSSVSAE